MKVKKTGFYKSKLIIAIGAYIAYAGLGFGVPIGLILFIVGLGLMYIGVNSHYNDLGKRFSKVYYLLPIVFSVIGSLIAYILFRKKNREVGSQLASIGVINLVVLLLAQYFLVATVYVLVAIQ